MSNVILSITFRDSEPSKAEDRAVRFLKSAGFSVGRKQAHSPRGILYGNYDVQKWRNLSERDRATLHGAIVADFKELNATFEIWDTLPDATARWFRMLIAERYMDASETFVANGISSTIQNSKHDLNGSIESRFGPEVTWRGTTGSHEEGILSISFTSKTGEITRLTLDFESATKLCASLNPYLSVAEDV